MSMPFKSLGPEIILKPQRIMPGSSFSSIVVCDTGAMTSRIKGIFKIVVSIDNEEHQFTFTRG